MRRTATSRVLSWLILCSSFISFTNASRPQQSQGNRRIQLMLTEGTSMAAAVSPDGRTVVIDLLGSLWILPSSGGIARRITDEFSDARQPAWSPEGRTIAFQSYRDGGWHIWTVAPDGTALKQLTSGPFDHREPHWSPDGARIAFSSDRSGNYDIWELALATGQLRQVTNDASNESMPAWSRDGREIAFVSDHPSSPGIWIIDASGQERVVEKDCRSDVCAFMESGWQTALQRPRRHPKSPDARWCKRRRATTKTCFHFVRSGYRLQNFSTPRMAK